MAEFKPLYDQQAIQTRIIELAREIEAGFNNEPVTVIGVLKGAFIFTADLVRALNIPVQIEFIGVASYEGTQSTGTVRITNDLSADIKGKNVLLIEDIIDTGRTIDFLVNTLALKNPKSIRVCALLSKPEAHVLETKIDHVGFEIANEFVVGYGLDYDQNHREIPYIALYQS